MPYPLFPLIRPSVSAQFPQWSVRSRLPSGLGDGRCQPFFLAYCAACLHHVGLDNSPSMAERSSSLPQFSQTKPNRNTKAKHWNGSEISISLAIGPSIASIVCLSKKLFCMFAVLRHGTTVTQARNQDIQGRGNDCGSQSGR